MIYFPNDHTPEEWRAKAAECYAREQESFERSDTDGYLSQWALGITAQIYRTCADVAERGGVWSFEMLADADGVIIEGAKEVKTKFGYAWVTPGNRWFNPSQARSAEKRRQNNLLKGFQFVTVERPAVVTTAEGGAFMIYPVVIPRRDSDEK